MRLGSVIELTSERITEGFYDTALNEGYCPNSVLLPTGGLDREN